VGQCEHPNLSQTRLPRAFAGGAAHGASVGANDIVMIHASMRRVGPVEGGAASVIEAVRAAVGPGGTLLMVLSAAENEPFDALRSPVDVADMGILAEVFRTYPGVSVNDHPADRFAALGPLASSLLEPTPLHDYHGPGSVLERLTERGGKVLRLGANTDTVTLTHYAEYLADVPNKVRVRRRYVRADTGEVWIESLDDNEGIATWDEGDYFPQIFLDYRASGAVRIGPVGGCEAELLDAARTFLPTWPRRSRPTPGSPGCGSAFGRRVRASTWPRCSTPSDRTPAPVASPPRSRRPSSGTAATRRGPGAAGTSGCRPSWPS
jgi:aminoglycoside N3'-acetyltransferase